LYGSSTRLDYLGRQALLGSQTHSTGLGRSACPICLGRRAYLACLVFQACLVRLVCWAYLARLVDPTHLGRQAELVRLSCLPAMTYPRWFNLIFYSDSK